MADSHGPSRKPSFPLPWYSGGGTGWGSWWRLARRRGFSPLPYICFLVFFAILLWAVYVWYLVPALKAAAVADKPERRILAAHALLLMSVILVILMLALLLTFRIGRFLFPTPTKRTKTQYTDAWAESAKRESTATP